MPAAISRAGRSTFSDDVTMQVFCPTSQMRSDTEAKISTHHILAVPQLLPYCTIIREGLDLQLEDRTKEGQRLTDIPKGVISPAI
jgi:hypothetical protein